MRLKLLDSKEISKLYQEHMIIDFRVNCFGVKYIILEAGKTHFKDKDEVWNLYERFYKSFLPEDKFNKNIRRLN